MIKIFVGTSANDEDLEAQAVFEYSLRKHHPADDIELVWMRLSKDSRSFWYSNPDKKEGWITSTWATPFSALRWGIPAACGYSGKAIYVDCDMIVMDDIAKLWNQEFQPGKLIIAKGEALTFCTMLMDCEGLHGVLPSANELKQKPNCYRDVRRMFSAEGAKYVQKFDGNWNCRDGEQYKTIHDPDVKILHYTAIPTQPTHRHAKARLAAEGRPHWYAGKSRPHPRTEIIELFDTTFDEALAHGFTLDQYRTEPFGDYRR